MDTCVGHLRQQACVYNFDSGQIDGQVKDQIVASIQIEELRRKLLGTKKLTISKALEQAHTRVGNYEQPVVADGICCI